MIIKEIREICDCYVRTDDQKLNDIKEVLKQNDKIVSYYNGDSIIEEGEE
jgi:hypothetical protein